MYRDNSGSILMHEAVVNDQLLFDYSPAESLINFELPNFSTEADWFSDFNFNDAFVGDDSNRDCYLNDNSTVLFDFDDLDNNIDYNEYLFDALTSDKSRDNLQSGTDSLDSSDALGRLSVLGIDLESTHVQDACVPKKDFSEITTSPQEKSRSWGEPEYCPKLGAFRCPVEDCKKLYAKASHVRAHLRRHSGEKPYQCTWGGCSWRFARSDELARHRRSHSGDKPYRCGECGKRFARSDHLAKHGRVHARRAAAAAAGVQRSGSSRSHTRTRRLL